MCYRRTYVEVIVLLRVDSFLSCGPKGWNSGPQAWQQASSAAEPSHQLVLYLKCTVYGVALYHTVVCCSADAQLKAAWGRGVQTFTLGDMWVQNQNQLREA